MAALQTNANPTVRELKVKQREGIDPLSTSGMVDPRLFTGENKLYAVVDPHSMLWSIHYEHGLAPQAFQQRFTSFNKLFTAVQNYYDRRNLDVTEVFDKIT